MNTYIIIWSQLVIEQMSGEYRLTVMDRTAQMSGEFRVTVMDRADVR